MNLLKEFGNVIAIPFLFSIALVVAILEATGVIKDPGLRNSRGSVEE